MFEQSIVETRGASKPWMLLAMTGQVVAAGITLMIPLMHPEVLNAPRMFMNIVYRTPDPEHGWHRASCPARQPSPMAELSYTLLRLVPKNTLSRAIGAACRINAPRPVMRAVIRTFARKYGVETSEAERAFEWFLGRNDLGVPLYDSTTGGCSDGLHADRINENQGAESSLAFHLALAEMNYAEHPIAEPLHT